MCLGDDCDLESPERRALLAGTGAAIVSLAAFGVPLAGQESPPPTRVLDNPNITHGPVTFDSGGKRIKVEWIHELESWFRTQGAPVEVFLYEGADHGFLAYTRPYYRPEDALLSSRRTIAFLRRNL